MRCASWFLGMFSVLVCGAFAQGAAQDWRSPHALVDEALGVLDVGTDIGHVDAIHFAFKAVYRDIVEGEHAGEPYVMSFGAGEEIDSLSMGFRLIETYDSRHQDVVAKDLTLGAADEIQSFHEGKRTLVRSALAPPAWEMRNPFRALLEARRASDLKPEKDEVVHESRQRVLAFTVNGIPTKVFIDANTHLITATETLLGFSHATSSEIAYNAMGDVRERTEFMLWELGEGLRYPAQWDTYRNGIHLQTITIGSAPQKASWDAKLELAPETLKMAESLGSSDLNKIALNSTVYGAPDPHRAVEEIAPGIVQIPASWYTTLVRQDDGIVVIDAPISSGYSSQVIAEAHRRFPGMPIKAVITSTAFFWHIAGIREYAARRIPIYVLDANESTVHRVIDAPHRLVVDELARSHQSPVIRVVHERTELGKGKNRIVIMPIRLATEPMLMSYIPDAKLLHTGEMIQPLGPGGSLLYPESLLEIRDSVIAEDIPVDRMIGMHMSPMPWADLESEVRKPH